MKRWNVWLILSWCCLFFAWGAKTANECERKAHASLSPKHRQELCQDAPVGHIVGPAICSISAKDSLRLKTEDILELCHGASSAAPADCMAKLDSSTRQRLGISLCAGATSSLPAQCFSSLSSFKVSGESKQSATENIVDFCSMLEDEPAPLSCAEAAMRHTTVGLQKALLICSDVVESAFVEAIPQCLQRMHKYIQPSTGVTADKIVKFCAELNPSIYLPLNDDPHAAISAAMDCFEQSSTLASGGGRRVLFSPQHRLSLCANAPIAQGPINCSLAMLNSRDSTQQVRAEDVVALCRAASGSGPASCYSESKGLGGSDLRIQLCNSAKNAGPAQCYRRASGVFRSDDQSRLELCVSATSEGPADCAAIAPHYLSASEKLHLCAAATPANYHDPSQCLQALQTLSPKFSQAPKKALGYFIENLLSDKERRSRQLLLQLCSFSESQDPLASAACFKSVPSTVEHDEAAIMCRNISSSEVIQHMLFCYRILPQAWTRPASVDGALPDSGGEGEGVDWKAASPTPAAILCEGLRDRFQVEAAVRCAVEASRLPRLLASSPTPSTSTSSSRSGPSRKPPGQKDDASSAPSFTLTLPEIASACNTETSDNAVLYCLRQAVSPHVTSALHSHHLLVHNHTLLDLCAGAAYKAVGDCLVQISSQATARHMILDSSVPAAICHPRSSSPPHLSSTSLLACLQATRKALITVQDVETCRSIRRLPTSARLYAIQTEEGGEKVVANQRFTLFFHVLDQFQQVYQDVDVDKSERRLFSIRLNVHNAQGAVLLGLRSNHTNAQGLVALPHLMITQPGPVELQIVYTQDKETHVLYATQLRVQENPVYKGSSPCLYLFSQARSVSLDGRGKRDEEDSSALFPWVRSVYAPHQVWRHLYCEEKVAVWQVKAFLLPSGLMLAEYRMGLEAIWTGMNMITSEMDMHDRLGITQQERREVNRTVALSHGQPGERGGYHKAMLKLVRRAYYRSSLQWHPDRWAGYDQYTYAVQAAFQLVTEAYEALQQLYAAPPRPEPVYA